jgi:hypothetical protein
MLTKRYLENLLHQCCEHNFGQEAVEWAILSGHIKLTYELVTDLHQIFDQRSLCCDAPPLGETCNHAGLCRQCQDHTTFITSYDEFCDAYRAHCRQQEAAEAQLIESYAPLLEEILRGPFKLQGFGDGRDGKVVKVLSEGRATAIVDAPDFRANVSKDRLVPV